MSPVTRGATALGVLALVFGVWALLVVDVGWDATRGTRLGAFVHLNLTGAVLLAVIGVLAMAGAVASRPGLVLSAALLAGLGTVLAVLGLGPAANLLGASGSTLSLFIALASGLAVTGYLARTPPGSGQPWEAKAGRAERAMEQRR